MHPPCSRIGEEIYSFHCCYWSVYIFFLFLSFPSLFLKYSSSRAKFCQNLKRVSKSHVEEVGGAKAYEEVTNMTPPLKDLASFCLRRQLRPI